MAKAQSYADNSATLEVHYEIRSSMGRGFELDQPWPWEIVVEQWATNDRTERWLLATRRYEPAADAVAQDTTTHLATPEFRAALAKVGALDPK